MAYDVNPVDYVAARFSGVVGAPAAPRLAAQAAAQAQAAGDAARAQLWRQVEAALKQAGRLGRQIDIRV